MSDAIRLHLVRAGSQCEGKIQSYLSDGEGLSHHHLGETPGRVGIWLDSLNAWKQRERFGAKCMVGYR